MKEWVTQLGILRSTKEIELQRWIGGGLAVGSIGTPGRKRKRKEPFCKDSLLG